MEKFKASGVGKKLLQELQETFYQSEGHKDSISFSFHTLSKWKVLKACRSREMILLGEMHLSIFLKSFRYMSAVFLSIILIIKWNVSQVSDSLAHTINMVNALAIMTCSDPIIPTWVKLYACM